MEQWLLSPENRAAVRAISQQVLVEVAPDEASVSARFIEPLIDMAAEGKMVNADNADQEMGLGGGELIVLIVVPTVTEVLGKLLVKLGEEGIEALKKRLKRDKEAKKFIEIKVDDIEAVVSRSRSPGAKKKVRELTRALNAALLAYLS